MFDDHFWKLACYVKNWSPLGSGGEPVKGSGTSNKIAKWSTSKELTDSSLTDDGSTITGTVDLTLTGTIAGTTITGANVTSGVDPGHTHTATSVNEDRLTSTANSTTMVLTDDGTNQFLDFDDPILFLRSSSGTSSVFVWDATISIVGTGYGGTPDNPTNSVYFASQVSQNRIWFSGADLVIYRAGETEDYFTVDVNNGDITITNDTLIEGDLDVGGSMPQRFRLLFAGMAHGIS